ncbi:hypothetical protein BDV10DRAFT_189102 [Aspergillus recurvatus]
MAARMNIANLYQMELYKPTEDERTRHPEKLWYLDNQELFPNSASPHNYYNDIGTSSPYLVEASNTTPWELQLQLHGRQNQNTQKLESRAVDYINAYYDGGYIADSVRQQITDPSNGVCYRWNSITIMSVFVVGSGNLQVNRYGNTGQYCNEAYLGSVKNWSGCWTTPSSSGYIRA